MLTEGTREAREELVRAMPDIVVDGLSLYNPALSMDHYPELRLWLGESRLTRVPADRHLAQLSVVLTQRTHEAREELVRTMPDIVVDGLSLYNPLSRLQCHK